MRDVSDWDIIPADRVKQSPDYDTIASGLTLGTIDGWYDFRQVDGLVWRQAIISTRRSQERYFEVRWSDGRIFWHRFGEVKRITHRANSRE